MRKLRRYRIYHGPSRIKPDVTINVFITIAYDNPKTGIVWEVFTLVDGMTPLEAVKTGADEAICGDCTMRPLLAQPGDARCYVNAWAAPGAVYRAQDNYEDAEPEEAMRRMKRSPYKVMRLGAYADPAAVDYELWERLGVGTEMFTLGYTHQWPTPELVDPRLWDVVMASLDENNKHLSHLLPEGVRTYRVMPIGGALEEGEIMCPHDATGVQCSECRLCGGAQRQAKNIAVFDTNRKPRKTQEAW